MLTITKSAPNRLDMELQGKVTTEEMQDVLDRFVTLSKEIEHGKILYAIHDFDFPSLDAIMVKLSRLPELFGLLKRFDRIAILTDKRWLQKVAALEGFLIPGLEIKAFDIDKKIEAEAWLER